MTIAPAADADLAFQVETLTEALDDTLRLLRSDEAGWSLFGEQPGRITREELRKIVVLATRMAIVDPLIKRGVSLRCAYVWGEGIAVAAEQEDGAEQDVNAVVQSFLDDQATSWGSIAARVERERAFATVGEYFRTFKTDSRGRVQVRTIEPEQIVRILTNPDDVASPWFYERRYTPTRTDATRATSPAPQEVRELHPALDFLPSDRPDEYAGLPVRWDYPILHSLVNRVGDRGTPDAYAAITWARGYKSFLEDCAKLYRALAEIAFRATAKTKAGAQQIRTRLVPGSPVGRREEVTALGAGEAPQDVANRRIGATAVQPEGQTFEAVNKSGAAIAPEQGRPFAALIAAALDVSIVELLADPGITGARAVAETLDRPTKTIFGQRRQVHQADEVRVLRHVVREAIRAGRLAGTIDEDDERDTEIPVLAGDQPVSFTFDWPELDSMDVATVVKAITDAEALHLIPQPVWARLLLAAFNVDNVDEILDQITDEDGNFVDPYATTANAAGQVAADALRNGADPADAILGKS